MHFHNAARCLSCQVKRVFSTPIPNIMVLSSMCDHCGFNDLVGLNGEDLCRACHDLWRDDVQREVRRDRADSPRPS